MTYVLTLAVAALVATAPAADDDGRYPIRIARTVRVGDACTMEARHRLRREATVTAEGRRLPLSRERQTVAYKGLATVTAVSDRGYPTEVQHTIEACALDGDVSWAADRGAVIDVRLAGEAGITISLDGEPLDRLRVTALESLFALGGDDEVDDGIFGSREPRRVGETWRLDPETAAPRLSREWETTIRPEDVSGSTTLVAVETHQGEPCLRLEFVLEVRDLAPTGDLPAAVKVRASSFKVEGEGIYPIRHDLPQLMDRTTVTIDLQMDGPLAPGQPDARIRTLERRTMETTWTPTKKGSGVTSRAK